MYKPLATFVFPHLVLLKEISFKSWNESSKTTKLYKLDWDDFDSEILKRHKEWNARCWPSTNFPLVQRFAPYYEGVLQKLRFAVPNHYLEEIRRSTQSALIEWHVPRHFDTVIREMCYAPAIKAVEVAFKLLCDCAYDDETSYYYRAENKYLLPHILLYRFWQHQTGHGMIQRHAGFEQLDSRVVGYKDLIERMLKDGSYKQEAIDLRKKEIERIEEFFKVFTENTEMLIKLQTDSMKLEECGSPTGPIMSIPAAPGMETEIEKRTYRYI